MGETRQHVHDPPFGNSRLVYMCTNLLPLAPGSLDLSQAKKRIIVCKAEQIHKLTLKIVLDEQSCHFE